MSYFFIGMNFSLGFILVCGYIALRTDIIIDLDDLKKKLALYTVQYYLYLCLCIAKSMCINTNRKEKSTQL